MQFQKLFYRLFLRDAFISEPGASGRWDETDSKQIGGRGFLLQSQLHLLPPNKTVHVFHLFFFNYFIVINIILVDVLQYLRGAIHHLLQDSSISWRLAFLDCMSLAPRARPTASNLGTESSAFTTSISLFSSTTLPLEYFCKK